MGRGREEEKEMERGRGRSGKGVQTWCKPFGGERGGCQHSLLCLNWGGSDRIYSMPATSLSPRTHTHYQCWGQSLAIGCGVCLLLLYCVSLHHRWGHRRCYYRCSYYYNLWGLGANKRASIKEHKEMRETRKKKTGQKNTRRSTREDKRSAFSLNTRPWLNLIELWDEDLPRDTTALRQRRMREWKEKDGQIMVLQGPGATAILEVPFCHSDNTANIRNKSAIARINTLRK